MYTIYPRTRKEFQKTLNLQLDSRHKIKYMLDSMYVEIHLLATEWVK